MLIAVKIAWESVGLTVEHERDYLASQQEALVIKLLESSKNEASK